MADAGENQETHRHPDGAEDEGFAAPEVLDVVEADEGDAEVDAVEDHLRDEGVVDARGLEDYGAVIEAAEVSTVVEKEEVIPTSNSHQSTAGTSARSFLARCGRTFLVPSTC